MRQILAAAAAATVAAFSVGAPPAYTLAANVLTLTGYTFGNTIEWDMDEIFQRSYCSDDSGNTCSEVRYLDGVSEVPAEITGLIALRWALATTPPPTTVLGFSQGATIASNWIKGYAGKAGAPAPANLSFVLAANPQRKYGGIRSHFGIDTPTPDSEYSVVDIAIEYDGAADFPDDLLNFLAVANALAGFQYIHIFGYQDVDLETADKLEWTEGNITYVLIRRENIPLLEPLRLLGLTELADTLNGPLKEIIDRAYNRDYPGLVTDTSARTVTQQLSASEDVEVVDEAPVVETTSTDMQPAHWATVGHTPVVSDELDITESDSPTVDLGETSPDDVDTDPAGEESGNDTAQDDDASDEDTAAEDGTDADEDSSPTAGPTSGAADDSGSAPETGGDSASSDSTE